MHCPMGHCGNLYEPGNLIGCWGIVPDHGRVSCQLGWVSCSPCGGRPMGVNGDNCHNNLHLRWSRSSILKNFMHGYNIIYTSEGGKPLAFYLVSKSIRRLGSTLILSTHCYIFLVQKKPRGYVQRWHVFLWCLELEMCSEWCSSINRNANMKNDNITKNWVKKSTLW